MNVSKELQQELLKKTTWDDALSVILSAGIDTDSSSLRAHILDMRSTFWRLLLPNPTQGNILHIGSSDWGKNALAFGESASKITYLDNQEWRLRLIKMRLKESGLSNVEFVNQTPQTSARFDLIVIYDISIIDGIKGLVKILTLLEPNGTLYINIGKAPGKYLSLLSKAGFNYTSVYSSVPHYLQFNYMIPIDEKHIFQYRLKQMDTDGLCRKVKKLAASILLPTGLLKYCLPNFSIIAQK